MQRSMVSFLIVLLTFMGCSNVPTDISDSTPPSDETVRPNELETVAENLNVPWELAFTEEGDIFFTERPGNLRLIRDGELVEEPLLSLPAPFISEGEGGLLGLAADPAFESNHFLYVYHSYEQDGAIQNRVLRLIVDGEKAQIDKVILDGIVGETNHNGGRLKIGPDGLLYITAGDRYEPEIAQKETSMGGKIFRIHLDGTIPDDNPFEDSPVYSYGHRNPQGLAWHPETGQLYSSEHGQTAHDEINLIQKGKNYGWPIVEGDETEEGMISPILHSGEETWAPSGMTFVTEGEWKNQLLVANLRGNQILRVELSEDGSEVLSSNALFKGEYGRIRTVTEAPDGSIYFLTNNRDGRGVPKDGDDKIFRMISK